MEAAVEPAVKLWMNRTSDTLRSWLREPLLHFLLIGAVLYLLFAWTGAGEGAGSNRIAVTSGQVEQLVAGFTRTWRRPPDEVELKGLIDEYVREEIAYREAIALGLDRDDTVIRRRLRQKVEFLAEDAAIAEPPAEQELQSWLDRHAEQFRIEPQVSFRQVYLDPTISPDHDRRVAELLRRVGAAGPAADLSGLGDALMLEPEYPLMPQEEVARLMGPEFAASVVALEPGTWAGPIASGYGDHLVLVTERVAGQMLPALEQVRPFVEREVLADRRKRELQRVYDVLLQRYSVTVEMPAEAR
jgi:hypothetical protein